MVVPPAPAWALILAGGDGTRLRRLTRRITGDARPKQFCPLLDGETLLDRTRRRVDLVARPDHQVVVVTRAHEPYYRALQRELAPGRLVVQPANRGTAAGLLYPLLRIADLAGDVPVAVFPSDHHVDPDATFAAHVETALRAVRAQPDRVVLLGVEAAHPETEYGWIEPGDTLPDSGSLRSIRRFWEKPPRRLAEDLLRRGCLWNSFVMVGSTNGLVALVRRAMPALVAAFEPIRAARGPRDEAAAAARVYATLPATSFSDGVLAPAVDRLAVLRATGVEWTDLGHPARVIAILRRSARPPAWLGVVAEVAAG
jgi:mannose-1-phosphate guanylyltransferase